jgi:hypothetical protein
MTEKQVAQVTDMMIGAGPKIFAGTQFFAVNSYEDVKPIADSKLTPEMVEGLGFFGNVQQALKAPDAKPAELLRDDEVKEDLRNTMVAMPSCVSARLLLRASTGQFDKLSAEGTFHAIENLAPTIFGVVQSQHPNDLSKLPNATVQAEIAKLEESRPHFDTNSMPVLDAVLGYGEVVRVYTERPAESVTENADRSRALLLTARAVLDAMAKFRAVQTGR